MIEFVLPDARHVGVANLVQLPAIQIERIAPEGRVELAGVVWNARGREPMEVGREIEVVAVNGLTVEVRPRT